MNSNSAEQTKMFVALLDTPELPSLGPTPRASRQPLPELNQSLEKLFHKASLKSETESLIRALVLLWHDYLDESHSLSQDLSSPSGSYIHGMMHRREPDYWNSKYWFNRVGSHPAYPLIAALVEKEITPSNEEIAAKIVASGKWTPANFVDLCQRFAADSSSTSYRCLQHVQQIETRVLLEYFCHDSAR